MPKKVLVTGGAGFIGSNLALRLLDRGYSVRVLDILSPQIHGNNAEKDSPLFQSISGKVEFIRGDVCNRQTVKKALSNIDIVVHFAAETGTGQSMYELERYAQTNISGTATLLQEIVEKRLSLDKFIIASSRSVYGEGKYRCVEHGIVYPKERFSRDLKNGFFELRCPDCGVMADAVATDETSMLNPKSIYAVTKLTQEQLVLSAMDSLGISAIGLRYQNVFGPGQSLSNPYTGILAIFSNLILNNQNINIFEDGKESRDFIYIDDVVGATIASIESKLSSSNVFNVGTGEKVAVLQVAEKLKELLGGEAELNVSGNYRIGDIRHNYADIKNLRTKLCFDVKYSFEGGIKVFVEWVKKNHAEKIHYEDSLDELRQKGLLK